MDKRSIALLFLLFCHHGILETYQPLEPDGLIGVLTAKTPVYLQKTALMRREHRQDGSVSRVFRINGRKEFERAVIASSSKRPVVLLILSSGSINEPKMQEVFFGVADMFKNVSFVSMNVLDQHAGNPENSELITQFMLSQNLTRLELPMMLFFKNGSLYAPPHESTAILQGLYSKEYLVGFIHSKFFGLQQPIIKVDAQDLTTTPLSHNSTVSSSTNSKSPEQINKVSKEPLRQRIANFFKRK